MAVFGEWGRRVWYLLNRRRFEDELRQDMETHRAMLDRPARFGRVLQLGEASRDVWGWQWLDQLAHDVRFGVRTLIRQPGFALTAILTLALATGATTAIFSVVNGVLLRPLPFADPDRLVQVHGRNWREERGNTTRDPVTGPVSSLELEGYIAQSKTFDGFVGYYKTTTHLDGPSGQERLSAIKADAGLFGVLGVAAVAGRTFRPGDPRDVAVISARLWEERFGSDPSLPGKTIKLEGQTFTVLGVMPAAFQFPYGAGSMLPGTLPESRTDVWLPIEPVRESAAAPLRRGRADVLARVKPGVGLEAAAAELGVIAARLEAQHFQGTRIRLGVRVIPLADVVLGPIRRSLWLLFAAVGLVLAAACANVANLLLARMTVRTREVVTRAALGASRLRLVRQFLAESLLLSLAGGLLGALVAQWGTNLLVRLGSAKIPRAHEVALDWQAFAFLLLACLVTAVLFGLAPALSAARVDVQSAAKEASGHATMGRGFGRIRDALVVVEVALAFILAVGAALVVREAIRLQKLDMGMVIENVITLHLTPRAPAADYYAIEQRVGQLPGARSAGFIQLMPLQNWGWVADFSIRGRVSEERSIAELRYVTPGYFKTLGIPIVRGRGFTEGDAADAPRVILINEALARRYFRSEDPVGRELDRGTIAGVVADVRQAGLDRPVEPVVFYPAAQNVTMASDIGMTLVVRATARPESLVDAIRAAVRGINPTLAIFNVKTMEQVVADSLWELTLYRWLIGSFAVLSLVLAAIGLYGVISYSVTSRMREFAVRLALGSNPAQLARLVVGRGAGLVATGLAVGLLATASLSPALRSVSANLQADPLTYAGVAVLMAAIALLACAVPAMRVAAVDPSAALRHE